MRSDLSDTVTPRVTLRPSPPSPSGSSPSSSHQLTFDHVTANNGLDDSHQDARPSKRQKTQACLRCKRRKQKCDYRKPCGNYVKADEQCHTASSVEQSQALATTAGVVAQDPLIRLAEIAALEERVSRIERMSDRSRSMNESGEPDNSRYHTQERPAFNNATSGSPSLLVDTPHLSRSTPAMALLAAFAAPTSEQGSPNFIAGATPRECPQGHIETMVDSATEEILFNIYNDKVQWRYPFLRLYQLRNRHERPSDLCTLFFVSMIYSISLLLARNSVVLQDSSRKTFTV